MKEKIKRILSELPNKVEVYVFGSILISQNANDLDILIIYDSKYYPRNNIYKCCNNIINTLHDVFKLDIDITALSCSENDEINFAKKVEAIRLDEFLYKFHINKIDL